MLLEDQIKQLEYKIEALISESQGLRQKNTTLANSKAQLLNERTELQEKNTIAKTKVEAIISKLRTLEQSS